MKKFEIGDTVVVIRPYEVKDKEQTGTIKERNTFGGRRTQYLIDFGRDLGGGFTHNHGAHQMYPENHYRWYYEDEIELFMIDEIDECTDEELMSIL